MENAVIKCISRVINGYRKLFWTNEEYARYHGVKIGKGCNIQTINWGTEPYLISIGDNTQITKGVSFYTHGGSWVFRKKFPNFDFFGKIKIGNNVYIGNHALILPGVTIQDDVVIGAGAVVTKSVPSGSIVGGNPAKIIGNLSEYEKRILSKNLNTKVHSAIEKKKILLSIPEEMFVIKDYMK